MPAGRTALPAGLASAPGRVAGGCPLAVRRRTSQLVRISASGDATLRALDRAESFQGEVEALVAALPAEALPLEEQLVQLKEQAMPAPDSPLGRFWRFYNNALESHPVAVKSATSFVGFLLGDVLAQTIVGADFDVSRTLRLVLFGMFMDGPVGARPCCAHLQLFVPCRLLQWFSLFAALCSTVVRPPASAFPP